MEKKKIFIISIGIVMVLMTSVLFVKLIQMRQIISSIYSLKNFNYEALVNLNGELLTEEQVEMLQGFCNLLGIEEELCWDIKGEVYNGVVYMELYNQGLEEPITDIYISESKKIINVKMIYENIKKNHSFVGTFLPDWSGAEYISVEQIEYITGVDCNNLFELSFDMGKDEVTIWQAISLFWGMEKDEDEKLKFQTQTNGYGIMIEVDSDKQFKDIKIGIIDNTGTQIMQQSNLSISMDSVLEINMPESLVSMESIENLRAIWSILVLINDKF